jgi:hypothetical protein
MASTLLPSRFLFRFSVPCRRFPGTWTVKGAELPGLFQLPALCELEDVKSFADVRAGWNEEGIFLVVKVSGKKLPIWCRENKMEDSDGLQVWIDTRDTQNIHRASRFCHRMVFLPCGGGRQFSEPVAEQLLVDRARENAQPMRPGQLRSRANIVNDGYELSVHIPAKALTGFNPVDNPKLGFTYFLFDREFGEQTFSASTQFPFASDPSLWGTLELVN